MGKQAIIKAVDRNSIAGKIGLLPGDEILSINGQDFQDFLEYKFLMTDEKIKLKVKGNDGSIKEFTVYKSFDEGLGVEFENPLMDDIKRCKNKCIFCFVDQMPPGLRQSLYVKDDDYRLSTAFGTFVTLTNLSQQELNRIVKLGLSPIYVSVHATSPEVRNFMMKNPHSGEVLNVLKFLTSHHILVHCQIVLCPEINDGRILEQTLMDLANLWPHILSIAVVPVGLTKFRERLYPLRAFTKDEADDVINFIEDFQKQSLKRFKTRLVFAADEFYCIAQRQVPAYETYEEFYQLENGVGMMALLKRQMEQNMVKLPPALPRRRKVAIATGVSAHKFLRQILNPLQKVKGLEYTVYPVVNNFFGNSVTVAGLITGADLAEQLKGKEKGSVILIPDVMLKDGDIFLDDLTVEDVGNFLESKLEVVKVNGKDFLNAILGKNGGM
jgi:putative radical SAM enzyme (TIGR03279 family)